ncbi:helix-turn-helix transcriptional regulator [Streptomyces sp. NPDC048018]|uniref:helix-turn-helix transcriptional regulator n=1 Tax=Streptomyces sp. NPDC048018 TaxID=3365499 RepID=UPI003711E0E3
MVDTPPEGETLQEIAARYGRAETTVRNQWARHPEWPAPIGKRGQAHVFDPTAVDRVVGEHLARPAAELEPRREYTAAEIEAATGISPATIRAEVSKGRWPAPDGRKGRANVWLGSAVLKAVEGRRAYRRGGSAPQG